LFQIALIVGGNLSFLNYLTIVPALACIDDSFWEDIVPLLPFFRSYFLSSPIPNARTATTTSGTNESVWSQSGRYVRTVVTWSYVLLVGYLLTQGPIQNLILTGAGKRQVMNGSYDPFHLVNTYGAFGSIGKVRHEIILSGTYDSQNQIVLSNITESASAATARGAIEWREYEFPCKPGVVTRTPCITAPYPRRLDWQMWFAAMQRPEQNGWLYNLMIALIGPPPRSPGTTPQEKSRIENDREATQFARALLQSPVPFAFNHPPKWIKADLYRYEYTSVTEGFATGAWWKRTFVRPYIAPLSFESLRILQQQEQQQQQQHRRPSPPPRPRGGANTLNKQQQKEQRARVKKTAERRREKRKNYK
jgi:hypothetical protein